MYRFSIVVPLVGEHEQFEKTLASVLRYRPDSCQIVAAHDGDYTDPHCLAPEVEFVSTNRPTHLIRLFNCGSRKARGEFIGIVRPGVELTCGWHRGILEAFEDQDTGSVAPALVDADNKSRLVSAGVNSSSSFSRQVVGSNVKVESRKAERLNPLGPTSWAAFYRSSLLESLGECDERLDPVFLDLDLALSLDRMEFDCQFVPDSIFKLDDPSQFTRESKLPHGRSAQRSLVRHIELSNSQRITKTITDVAKDLAGSLIRPSRLKHAFARLGNGKFHDTDEDHWDLISLLIKQRRWILTKGEQVRSSTRRAA